MSADQPAAGQTPTSQAPAGKAAAGQPAPGQTPARRGAAGQSAASQGAAKAAKADRPGYEQARDQLTDLVKRLEAGGLTLEQSLDLWERGERLAAICEEWLDGARARLAATVAKPGQNGAADQPPDAETDRPF